MKLSEITAVVEQLAPPRLQETWDNSGLQIGLPDGDGAVTGVLLCLDVTEAVVAEAEALGVNLIVSHHPLIFKGLKSLSGATPQQRAAYAAIRAGIAVYSAHTSLDSAPGGVSHAMATRMGARVAAILAPDASGMAGLGVVAEFDAPLSGAAFVERLHSVFTPGAISASAAYRPDMSIRRIAMCGGSGGEFIADARRAGVDAYVSADIRYHDMADAAAEGFAVFDIGHFESELCALSLIDAVISEKFPNFAHYFSVQSNPIVYL